MDKIIRIKSPNVVHETIDGEVVIINFENGCYYSLRNTACLIWYLIHSNELTQSDLVNYLAGKYKKQNLEINTDIASFINQLENENLIINMQSSDCNPGLKIKDLDTNFPEIYETPKCEIYADMQQTILLDPVHDVGEEGWPNKK